MSGDSHTRRKLLPLILFLLASRPCLHAQASCPVALITASAKNDTIELEFRNKSKVPIEQLTLACTPAGNNKFPNGVCHEESGFFYPGTAAWLRIDYRGATHQPIEISIARLRLEGNVLWQATHTCKPLKLPRKN